MEKTIPNKDIIKANTIAKIEKIVGINKDSKPADAKAAAKQIENEFYNTKPV